MPRSLSAPFIRGLLSGATGVRGLLFVQLTHSTLPTPIRVVQDVTIIHNGTHVPYQFGGITWQAVPFGLSLFNDSEDIAETKITIQNVDRQIGLAVMAIPADEALELSLTIYSSSDFVLNGAGTQMVATGTPTVQYQCPQAFIRNIEWDSTSLTGDVRLFDPSKEPVWYLKASPDIAPGLWL